MTIAQAQQSGVSASLPPHDPGTWRNCPIRATPLDRHRVESLLRSEWERFVATTAGSAAHHQRASRPLPLGVASSFQHWEPYPIAIESARGAWLYDVDGRPLLDMSMGFGAMLVGSTIVDYGWIKMSPKYVGN